MNRFTISMARHPKVARLIQQAKQQKSPRLNVSDIVCDILAQNAEWFFKNSGLKPK